MGLVMFAFGLVAGLNLGGAARYQARPVARLNVVTLLVDVGLMVYAGSFLNGPFNVLTCVVIGLAGMLAVLGLIVDARALARRAPWLVPVDWRGRGGRNAKIVAGVLGLVTATGLLAGFSFGLRYTVHAPEDFQTRSSYWGPPALTLETSTRAVMPAAVDTIHVTNDSMSSPPPGYAPGFFAYATNLTREGGSAGYLDYAAGTRSYPNGTIFLAAPLPDLAPVNLTFAYIRNSAVIRALAAGNSTLVMNYHGDFVYHPPFARVSRTYLFQLLDYWGIDYYLDVYNGIEFPHVFNYLDSIPLCYQTLNWAHAHCAHFRGISLDFESGSYAVPPGRPGGAELFPGTLIPEEWGNFRDSWYHLNEQNQSLYAAARTAYEGVYQYAAFLGYQTYLIYGGELLDLFDGDLDRSRIPIWPISETALYGKMSYHENDPEGRYRCWQDCRRQIRIFGDQGRSILLGWIQQGSAWYTDDEQGLERYLEDCRVAQAAGMTEIYHAPLYRLQRKWGDAAVLRLHQALNEEPKQAVSFRSPPGQFRLDALEDYLKNFNRPGVFSLVLLAIALWILFFGTGGLLEILQLIPRLAGRPRTSPQAGIPEKTTREGSTDALEE